MGRPWHWIAAGTAVVAVVGAVLVNDTSNSDTFVAQPFATVDYTPEVGSPIVATPKMDATTKSQPTAAAPPPAVKPTNPPPRQPAAPQHPPPTPESPQPSRWTITITVPTLPVYFPDCDTAKFFGAAPIRRNEPGYREELDRDRDGVACEK